MSTKSKSKVKVSHKTLLDQPNLLAYRGIEAGSVAKNRRQGGDFTGLVVRALEAVPGTFHSQLMLTAFQDFEQGVDAQMIAAKLRIDDASLVAAVIGTWFQKYWTDDLPALDESHPLMQAAKREEARLGHDHKTHSDPRKRTSSPHCLLCRMACTRNDPLNFKFVVEAVPDGFDPTLVGKSYDHAIDLHLELDDMLGKPPGTTSYAATWGMEQLAPGLVWQSFQDLRSSLKVKEALNAYVVCIEESPRLSVLVPTTLFADFPEPSPQARCAFVASVRETSKKKAGSKAGSKRKKTSVEEQISGVVLVVCGFQDRVNDSEAKREKSSASIAASTLQKAIRRCHKEPLLEAIPEMINSPNVTRADLNFATCSGTRQLLWRLWITILEDVHPFALPDNAPEDQLSLVELGALALLAQVDVDFRLPTAIVERVQNLALAVMRQPMLWKWRDLPIPTEIDPSLGSSPLLNLTKVLLKAMPAMSNDVQLMSRLFAVPNKELLEANPFLVKDMPALIEPLGSSKVTALDHHCLPWIILMLQGCLPLPPTEEETTEDLAAALWDLSSRLNWRYETQPKPSSLSDAIWAVQYQVATEMGFIEPRPTMHDEEEAESLVVIDEWNQKPLSDNDRRGAFISLFGSSVQVPSKDHGTLTVVVSGTPEQPCKVLASSAATGDSAAYLDGPARAAAENIFLERYAERTVATPAAPYGFRWKDKKSKSVLKTWREGDEIKFAVNGRPVASFDAIDLIEPSKTLQIVQMPTNIENLVQIALYLKRCGASLNAELFQELQTQAAKNRAKIADTQVYQWLVLARESKLDPSVWKDLHTKIVAREKSGVVEISPVGRDGKHQGIRAVRRRTEGTMLRIMHLLCALYPHVFKLPKNSRLSFKVKCDSAQYSHAVYCLKELSQGKVVAVRDCPLPRITKALWPHQQETANRVVQRAKQGCRGFADASVVGAGKTLSALAACIALFGLSSQNHGCLVLVPTIGLISEWKEQIDKFTEGFVVLTQAANGVLYCGVTKATPEMLAAPNAIVITCLGRARDHPFKKPWSFVILDECTFVQNESAMQSAEAWRQVVSSTYGVLMLSATFFRARFAKLLYMLRMLGTSIPLDNKDYLHAILSEHIICHVPDNKRTWKIRYREVELEEKVRSSYDKLMLRMGNGDRLGLFQRLKNLLEDEFDVVSELRRRTQLLSAKGRRVLLFARTKGEASRLIEGWVDKPSSCVIKTVREGSHGLNLQHDCDVIVTRPAPGDIMEQMKGRIDRPGQACDLLLLDIVFAKNTIEAAEAANIRLCGNFVREYLKPISNEFKLKALEVDGAKQIEQGWQAKLANQEEDEEPTKKNKRKKPAKDKARAKVKKAKKEAKKPPTGTKRRRVLPE